MTSVSPTSSASSPDRHSPPPAAKARSFCEGPSSSAADPDARLQSRYSIQRSASSDARLPSPTDEEDDDYDDHRDYDCDDYDCDDGIIPRLDSAVGRSGGNDSGMAGSRRGGSPLQTIESEKCLVDLVVGGGTRSMPRRRSNASPRRNNNARRQDSAGSHESLVSHYSVDAGKHGFLSYPPPPPPDNNLPPQSPLSSSSFHRTSGSDHSVASGGGGNGNHGGGMGGGGGDCDDSLIFKYSPGRETPPAEYALPASILEVYGDTDLLLKSALGPTGAGAGAYGGGGGSSSLPPPPPPPSSSSLGSIRYAENDRPDSSARTARTIALSAGGREDGETHDGCDRRGKSSRSSRTKQQRILPYHERKRLTRLLAEEKRRRKAAARNPGIRDRQQSNDKKKMTTDDGKGRTTDAGEGSSLNGRANGYGGTDDNSYLNDDRGNVGSRDVDNSEESAASCTRGWFGGLIALITGQDGKCTTESSDDEENQLMPKRKVEGTENSYREQAEAFLRRTERERAMMKEQYMRANNLHGGHRSRRSTGSATLDSIASCSDDDDDDETSSSDEGSDSSYLDDDARRDSNTTSNAAAPATPARVWKYGEPPTVSDPGALAKKKDNASRRDRIMRRERLLQEDCDYRMHTFKRRHEAFSKKFRVFVVVMVAVIFMGILGFAFAVCVRMLTSLR